MKIIIFNEIKADLALASLWCAVVLPIMFWVCVAGLMIFGKIMPALAGFIIWFFMIAGWIFPLAGVVFGIIGFRKNKRLAIPATILSASEFFASLFLLLAVFGGGID